MKTTDIKFILLVAVALVVASVKLSATIADPKPFKYKQPDGKEITVQLHGDENFHWTTVDGKNMLQDAMGYYRPESDASFNARRQASMRNIQTRSSLELTHPKHASTAGRPHFLVLLVEFSDLKFAVSEPQRAFSDLLNKKGYSANGGTGSVNDYFYENSSGRFDPIFDVVGPITLDKSYTYYGAGDVESSQALNDACLKIDSDLDFSQYDTDHDGYVDNVFFYFAGHNEAEGGGYYTIWPHSWCLYYFNCVCDGVRVWQYACSSELRGNRGTNMCGIGTFCHEFGHVLGLPDVYDINYGTGGYAFTLESYSLMASGNYNNEGRTPPYLTGEERYLLGWMDSFEEWTSEGTKTVEPIQNNRSYRTRTTTEGECFAFETRNGKGWDAPLPEGMLVMHIDKSDRNVHGKTAKQRWNDWELNTYYDHPCYYIVTANKGNVSDYPFPGASNKTWFTFDTSPSFLDWNGKYTGFGIDAINFDGEKTTLFLMTHIEYYVRGMVSYQDGTAVVGAKVELWPSGTAGEGVALYSAETDDSGYYQIELPDSEAGKSFDVTVGMQGYNSLSSKLTVSQTTVRADFEFTDDDLKPRDLSELDYNYIIIPEGRLFEGDSYSFRLCSNTNPPESVEWFFDGELQSSSVVELSAGIHTVQAKVRYGEGQSETLSTEIQVEQR